MEDPDVGLDQVLDTLNDFLVAAKPAYGAHSVDPDNKSHGIIREALEKEGISNAPPLVVTAMSACLQAAVNTDPADARVNPLGSSLRALPMVLPLMLSPATDGCYGQGTYSYAMDQMVADETRDFIRSQGEDPATYLPCTEPGTLHEKAALLAAVAMERFPGGERMHTLVNRLLAGDLSYEEVRAVRETVFVCLTLAQGNPQDEETLAQIRLAMRRLIRAGELGDEGDEATGAYTWSQRVLLVWLFVLLFVIAVQPTGLDRIELTRTVEVVNPPGGQSPERGFPHAVAEVTKLAVYSTARFMGVYGMVPVVTGLGIVVLMPAGLAFVPGMAAYISVAGGLKLGGGLALSMAGFDLGFGGKSPVMYWNTPPDITLDVSGWFRGARERWGPETGLVRYNPNPNPNPTPVNQLTEAQRLSVIEELVRIRLQSTNSQENLSAEEVIAILKKEGRLEEDITYEVINSLPLRKLWQWAVNSVFGYQFDFPEFSSTRVTTIGSASKEAIQAVINHSLDLLPAGPPDDDILNDPDALKIDEMGRRHGYLLHVEGMARLDLETARVNGDDRLFQKANSTLHEIEHQKSQLDRRYLPLPTKEDARRGRVPSPKKPKKPTKVTTTTTTQPSATTTFTTIVTSTIAEPATTTYTVTTTATDTTTTTATATATVTPSTVTVTKTTTAGTSSSTTTPSVTSITTTTTPPTTTVATTTRPTPAETTTIITTATATATTTPAPSKTTVVTTTRPRATPIEEEVVIEDLEASEEEEEEASEREEEEDASEEEEEPRVKPLSSPLEPAWTFPTSKTPEPMSLAPPMQANPRFYSREMKPGPDEIPEGMVKRGGFQIQPGDEGQNLGTTYKTDGHDRLVTKDRAIFRISISDGEGDNPFLLDAGYQEAPRGALTIMKQNAKAAFKTNRFNDIYDGKNPSSYDFRTLHDSGYNWKTPILQPTHGLGPTGETFKPIDPHLFGELYPPEVFDDNFYLTAYMRDTSSPENIFSFQLVPVKISSMAYYISLWREFRKSYGLSALGDLCFEGAVRAADTVGGQTQVITTSVALCVGEGDRLNMFQLMGEEIGSTHHNIMTTVERIGGKRDKDVNRERAILELSVGYFQHILKTAFVPDFLGERENLFGVLGLRILPSEKGKGYPLPANGITEKYPHIQTPLVIDEKLRHYLNMRGEFVNNPNSFTIFNPSIGSALHGLAIHDAAKWRVAHFKEEVWRRLWDFNDADNLAQTRLREFMYDNRHLFFFANARLQSQLEAADIRTQNIDITNILEWSAFFWLEGHDDSDYWNELKVAGRLAHITSGKKAVFSTTKGAISRLKVVGRLAENIRDHVKRSIRMSKTGRVERFTGNEALYDDCKKWIRDAIGLLFSRSGSGGELSLSDNLLEFTVPLADASTIMALDLMEIKRVKMTSEELTDKAYRFEYTTKRKELVQDLMRLVEPLAEKVRADTMKQKERSQVMAETRLYWRVIKRLRDVSVSGAWTVADWFQMGIDAQRAAVSVALGSATEEQWDRLGSPLGLDGKEVEDFRTLAMNTTMDALAATGSFAYVAGKMAVVPVWQGGKYVASEAFGAAGTMGSVASTFFSILVSIIGSRWTLNLFQAVLAAIIPTVRYIRLATSRFNNMGFVRENKDVISTYNMGIKEPDDLGLGRIISPGTLTYLCQPMQRIDWSDSGEVIITAIQNTPMTLLLLMMASNLAFDSMSWQLSVASLVTLPAFQTFRRICVAVNQSRVTTHNRVSNFYFTGAETRLSFDLSMGPCHVIRQYHIDAVEHATAARAMIVTSNLYGEQSYLAWLLTLGGKDGTRGQESNLSLNVRGEIRGPLSPTFLGRFVRLGLARDIARRKTSAKKRVLQAVFGNFLLGPDVGRDVRDFGAMHLRYAIENWGFLIRNPYFRHTGNQPLLPIVPLDVLRCGLISLIELVWGFSKDYVLPGLKGIKPEWRLEEEAMVKAHRPGWKKTGREDRPDWMFGAVRILHPNGSHQKPNRGKDDFKGKMTAQQMVNEIERRAILWCTFVDLTVLPLMFATNASENEGRLPPTSAGKSGLTTYGQIVARQKMYEKANELVVNDHAGWPIPKFSLKEGYSAFNTEVRATLERVGVARVITFEDAENMRSEIIQKLLRSRMEFLDGRSQAGLTGRAYIVTSFMLQVLLAATAINAACPTELATAKFKEACDACFMMGKHDKSATVIAKRKKELAEMLVGQLEKKNGDVIKDLYNYVRLKNTSPGPFDAYDKDVARYAMNIYPLVTAFMFVGREQARLATCIRTIYTAGYVATKHLAKEAVLAEMEGAGDSYYKFFLGAFGLEYKDLGITYNSALNLPRSNH